MSNLKLSLKHIGVRHVERMFSILDLPPSNREDVQRVLANMYLGAEMESIGRKNVESGKKFIRDMYDIPNTSGEHDIVTIKPFELSVKVSNPRASFDQDMFIDAIADKFDIAKSELFELAKTCKKHSAPPTSFKVSLTEDQD